MEIQNYKKRIVDEKIERYLKLFGAVCIEGPKYCGKTWSGRYQVYDSDGSKGSEHPGLFQCITGVCALLLERRRGQLFLPPMDI